MIVTKLLLQAVHQPIIIDIECEVWQGKQFADVGAEDLDCQEQYGDLRFKLVVGDLLKDLFEADCFPGEFGADGTAQSVFLPIVDTGQYARTTKLGSDHHYDSCLVKGITLNHICRI